jgi:hypothetical protein
MCLNVDLKKTENFKQVGKRKVPLQKALIVHDDGRVTTPYQGTEIEAGWLRAPDALDRITLKNFRKLEYAGEIKGGAIHAYTAKADCSNSPYEVVKCWAYAEDFIATDGRNEMTFKKIWLPIEEIERITKKAIRRKRDRERRKRRKAYV